MRCEKLKSRNSFDPIMLERWTKNRNLTKSAECKNCAAARGAKTHEPQRSWLHATYKCMKSRTWICSHRSISRTPLPGYFTKKNCFWKKKSFVPVGLSFFSTHLKYEMLILNSETHRIIYANERFW